MNGEAKAKAASMPTVRAKPFVMRRRVDNSAFGLIQSG